MSRGSPRRSSGGGCCSSGIAAPVPSTSGGIFHGCGNQETREMSRQMGKAWCFTSLVVVPSFAWGPHHFSVEPMSTGTLSTRFPKGAQANRCLYGSLNPPQGLTPHPSCISDTPLPSWGLALLDKAKTNCLGCVFLSFHEDTLSAQRVILLLSEMPKLS